MPTLKSRALNPSESNEKFKLLQSFGDVWSHLKFSLDENLSLQNLKDLVSQATDLSLILKTHLQKTKNSGKPFRLVPGNVKEYLNNLENFPQDSKTFISEILHAAFTNQRGFVVKISKEEFDQLVSGLIGSHHVKSAASFKEIKQLENEIKDSWAEMSKVSQEIFALFDHKGFGTPEHAESLKKILVGFQSAHQQLFRFHQKVLSEVKNPPEVDVMSESSEEGTSELEKENEDLVESKVTDSMPDETIEIGKDVLEPPKPPAQESSSSPSPKATNNAALRRVESDVGHIQEGLVSLSHDIQSLQVGEGSPQDDKTKLVTELHKKCIGFSEGLMKDLYALDEMSVEEGDRQKRKEQVKRIQSMTNDVDNLLAKLHDLIESFKSERKKVQVEEKVANIEIESKKSESTPLEQEAHTSKPDPIPVHESSLEARDRNPQKKPKTDLHPNPTELENMLVDQSIRLESLWRRMKLSPRLNVEEASDGYLIHGYIPGMKREDVFISTTQEGKTPVLSIRGHRSPSIEEMALMRRQLIRAGFEPTDEAILRLGMGRFGTFLEKFAIPADVEESRIAGGYEGGELKVILPKTRLQRIPLGRPLSSSRMFDPDQLWW